jgi:hypothetical protein
MVKIAYHIECKHQFGDRSGRTTNIASPCASKLLWKMTWKFNIPSKVKIFLWDAFHGSDPVKSYSCTHRGGGGKVIAGGRGYVTFSTKSFWTLEGVASPISAAGCSYSCFVKNNIFFIHGTF